MDFSRRTLAAVVLLLICGSIGRASVNGAAEDSDPRQMVREMVSEELRSQDRQSQDDRLWSYRKRSRKGDKELLWQYCDTKKGSLYRLLTIDGKPLTPAERRAEERRIHNHITSPVAVKAARKKELADGKEEQKFLKLLPVVFRYQKEERHGNLQTLSFSPDPAFSPSGNEERVIHTMQGKLVLDLEQKRLVSIRGRLLSEVKFWGGLAGHLDAGGTFFVESMCVAPGDWELKILDIQMRGKALFFKTISVQQHDEYSQYAEVPANITLSDAAELVKKDSGT